MAKPLLKDLFSESYIKISLAFDSLMLMKVLLCLLAAAVIYAVALISEKFSSLRTFIRDVLEEYYKLKQENARLAELSTIDAQTGLLNRRGFSLAFKNFCTSISRGSHDQRSNVIEGMTVLMGDIDFFKKINDTYGHMFGDKVIKIVADIISNHVREGDMVCRFGGEEYLIALSGISADHAKDMAERIRHDISQYSFYEEGVVVNVTMSFGVIYSQYLIPDLDEVLIKRADDALYKAKEGGRNQVVFETI